MEDDARRVMLATVPAYLGPVGTRPPDIAGLTEWRPLARGGFAMVWQARQTTLNRLVAVKIDDRQLDSERERRRFLREAGAAGRMLPLSGLIQYSRLLSRMSPFA